MYIMDSEIESNPLLEASVLQKPETPSPEALILYELSMMNETFVTERALSSKQLLEVTKLSKQINEQLEQLKTLAPEVHKALFNSVNKAAASVASIIAKQTTDAAIKSTVDITHKLERMTQDADNTFKYYQAEVRRSRWKAFAFAAVLTLSSSLLTVWLVLPKPKSFLPLTQHQIHYLVNGMILERIWPKLSEKEKVRWNQLMKRRD